MVTPPLFTLTAASENTVRILYVGEKTPSDREQLYLFNSKATPAVDKNPMGKNTLQIAVQSEINIFLRPKNLSIAVTLFTPQGGNLVVTYPYPYYVTLVAPTVGGGKLTAAWLNPKATWPCPLKALPAKLNSRPSTISGHKLSR